MKKTIDNATHEEWVEANRANHAASTREILWRCPACGCYRATLKMPEETEQRATNRLIDDHINLGCAAYSLYSLNPKAEPYGRST